MSAQQIAGLIEAPIFERMVTVRRDLHRHPELSWEEHRTAGKVGEALDALGIPHRRLCDTGVVAEIAGPEGAPLIALRADLDALPIHEETGLPFASETPGVMHACGHDGHVSMLLGAAEVLSRMDDLPCAIRLIFQPAEEKGAGAKAMVDEGVLEDVELIFGAHLDRHFSPGTLVVTEGAVSASTDAFCIDISGRGGHAARPHESVDAVVVGSLMVMAIQTIVSREVNPASPAVVSVGRFDAGTVGNAIAGRAVLEGTIRTQDEASRQSFKAAVERIATSVGRLHGARVEIDFRSGTPVVSNTSGATELAREAARAVCAPGRVTELTQANMGGEDFAYFLEQIPGCYIRVGSQVEGGAGFPAHSSRFDFDEQALRTGAAWMIEVVRVGGRAIRERKSVE
ncbi:MAG: M20 family metallopeptidase [Gemmatimonadota bacterium]|nr:M20 family metallopeptidase [Gemmatimonadota bacterium]